MLWPNISISRGSGSWLHHGRVQHRQVAQHHHRHIWARETAHGELYDEQQIDVGPFRDGRYGHQQETLTATMGSSRSAIQDDACQAETTDSRNVQMPEQSEDELEHDARDLGGFNRSRDDTQGQLTIDDTAELTDAVNALKRATSIFQSEMTKNLVFFSQRKLNTAVADAAAFSSAEKQKLVALRRQPSDDNDSELSALAAVANASHSSDTLDVLVAMQRQALVIQHRRRWRFLTFNILIET